MKNYPTRVISFDSDKITVRFSPGMEDKPEFTVTIPKDFEDSKLPQKFFDKPTKDRVDFANNWWKEFLDDYKNNFGVS